MIFEVPTSLQSRARASLHLATFMMPPAFLFLLFEEIKQAQLGFGPDIGVHALANQLAAHFDSAITVGDLSPLHTED